MHYTPYPLIVHKLYFIECDVRCEEHLFLLFALHLGQLRNCTLVKSETESGEKERENREKKTEDESEYRVIYPLHTYKFYITHRV